MKEWDLMKEIAYANNNNDDELLATIVMKNDFTGKPNAINMINNSFELTIDNISKHVLAAKRILSFKSPDDLRGSMRFEILKELIDEIEDSNND